MSGLFAERIERWLTQTALILLCAIMLGLAIHTPMTVFASVHWPAIALYVKAWKEVLLAIAFMHCGIWF